MVSLPFVVKNCGKRETAAARGSGRFLLVLFAAWSQPMLKVPAFLSTVTVMEEMLLLSTKYRVLK